MTGHDLERMFLSPGPHTESVEGSYLCLVPAYSTPPRYDHNVKCCHWMLDQCYEISFIMKFNKRNISNDLPVLTVQYIGYIKSGIQHWIITHKSRFLFRLSILFICSLSSMLKKQDIKK